jgi:hypothetical protein
MSLEARQSGKSRLALGRTQNKKNVRIQRKLARQAGSQSRVTVVVQGDQLDPRHAASLIPTL